MKALAGWLRDAVGSASPGANPEALRWAISVLKDRERAFHARWYDPRLSAIGWRKLRSRLHQLREDINILEHLLSLAAGVPRAEPPAPRSATGSGYGEP